MADISSPTAEARVSGGFASGFAAAPAKGGGMTSGRARQRRSKSLAKIASDLQIAHSSAKLVDSRVELAPLEEHLLSRDEPPPVRTYAHKYSRSYSLPKLNIGSFHIDEDGNMTKNFTGFNGPVPGSNMPVNLAPQEPGLSPQLDAWVERDLAKQLGPLAATQQQSRAPLTDTNGQSRVMIDSGTSVVQAGMEDDGNMHGSDTHKEKTGEDAIPGSTDDAVVRRAPASDNAPAQPSHSSHDDDAGVPITMEARGIDRSSLLALGLSTKSIDRLYRGLLAHRSSLRSLLHRELAKASHTSETAAVQAFKPMLGAVAGIFSGVDMVPGLAKASARDQGTDASTSSSSLFTGDEYIDVSAEAENLRLLIETKGAWELRFRCLQDQVEEQKKYKEQMRDRVNELMLELSTLEDQSEHQRIKYRSEMSASREQLQFALHAKRAMQDVLTERKNELASEIEAHNNTKQEVENGLARERQQELEREALARRLASLTADKEALNKFLERLKAEMAAEREKMCSRQDEMDSWQSDLERKLRSYQVLEKERDVAKKLYDEETRRCAELGSNVHELQESVTKLERNIDGRGAEIERLKNNLKHKSDVIAKLHKQLEDHDALQALVDDFRSKQDTEAEIHEGWRRQVCLEQMRCEEEAALCLTMVKEQADKVGSLKEEVRSQEARLLRGRKENETCLKQVIDMRNALTTALERTADSQAKLDLTHDAMARVEAEKAELVEELKQARQTIASNEKRIESLKKQLADLTTSLEHQKKKTNTTMADLVEQKRAAASAQDDFDAKISMANKKLDIANKRIAALEKVREELIPLRNEHAKLVQSHHELMLSESSLKSQLEQKLKNIALLEDDREKMGAEIDALQANVASLEKSLRVTEHELSAKCDMEQLLSTRNRKLDESLKKATTNVTELVRERERLTEDLMNEQHNVRRLSTELEARNEELSNVNSELRASEDAVDKLRGEQDDLRKLMAESMKTAEEDRKRLEKSKYELEVDINHLLETISTRKYVMNEESQKTVQRIKDDIMKSNSATAGTGNTSELSAHDKMKLIAEEAKRREEEARADAVKRMAAHRFKTAAELMMLRDRAAKMDSMTKHQIKEAMAEFQGKLTSVETRLERAMTEAEKVPVLEAQVGALKMEKHALEDKLETTETESRRYKDAVNIELKKTRLELETTQQQAKEMASSLRLKERFAAGLVGKNKEVTLQNIKLGKCPETSNFACQVSYADMFVNRTVDTLLTKDMMNNWIPVVLPRALEMVVGPPTATAAAPSTHSRSQARNDTDTSAVQHTGVRDGMHAFSSNDNDLQQQQGLSSGHPDTVPPPRRHINSARVTSRMIQAIYSEKLKADSVAQRQCKPLQPMAPFVWTYFFNRYGLPEAAEQGLVDFVAGVLANCGNNAEIEKFGRLCLILDSIDNVTEDVSGDGQSGLPSEYEDADAILAPTTMEDMLTSGSMRDPSLMALRHQKARTTSTSFGNNNAVTVDVLAAASGNMLAAARNSTGGKPVAGPLRHATVKDVHLLNLRSNQMGGALSLDLAEFRDKFMLSSLPASTLQHPLVDEATKVFALAPGVESVLAQLENVHFEVLMRGLDIGLPIDDDQLPQLHFLLEEACDLLHMRKPLLYIRPDLKPDAFTVAMGMREPAVVLTSGAVDLLNPMELQALLAMQLSNLRNGDHHAPATACALMRVSPETFLQLDGVKRDWLQGLKLSLERWEKFSMLSGDRSAMVVAQEYNYVAGAVFKLAGGSQVLAGQLSIDVLLEHLQQLETSYIAANAPQVNGFTDGINTTSLDDPAHYHASRMTCLVSDNSFALLRARELKKFMDSEYDDMRRTMGARSFRRAAQLRSPSRR